MSSSIRDHYGASFSGLRAFEPRAPCSSMQAINASPSQIDLVAYQQLPGG